MKKIAILVNLSANHNKASEKWERIKDKLQFVEENTTVYTIPYEVPFDVDTCVADLYGNKGVTHFISAGGDGSINYLINAINDIPDSTLDEFTIGAIGLGSSNDFLKPFDKIIDGIPVKIDDQSLYDQDVGSVVYESENGNRYSKLFIINASIGLLAKANYTFNKGDGFINFFKRRKLDWAINYTALKTLLTYKPSWVNILSGTDKKHLKLNSLSVLKNPNVSGSFRFNQDILSNDRSFGINYSYNQNIIGVIRTILDLAKGCFITTKPKKGRTSYKGDHLEITSKDLLYLETDGEVEVTRNAVFSIYPNIIKIMK